MKRRTKKGISARRREALTAYGFLAPNLLGFLAFTSIPVIISLAMSFTHWNIFHPPTWLGLENYRQLLWLHREHGRIVANDPMFWKYVGNTLFLMMAIPVGMAASLIVAMLMNRKLRGIVIYRTVYFLPAICSGVALLILWKYLYNADIGLINSALRSIGIANPPDWLGTVLWAKPALMLMGLWGGLGRAAGRSQLVL
jgi:multiple sugar transport system permease protein